jgi:hypothetical protein
MKTIPMCPNCGNTNKNYKPKKCSACKKITCQKCSFTGCPCGSMSIEEIFEIK